MDLGLNGKVAIVTGAGSVKGFGRAIATTLASEGCDLVVNDMRLDWAEKVAEEIRASGRKAVAVRADVASKEEVDSMAARALETFGRIDILVNNAGTMSGSGTSLFIDSRKEEWDREIDVNLKGVLNCCHAVVKHMVGRKSGKIVNIASGAGKSGAPRCVAYSASKGGLSP